MGVYLDKFVGYIIDVTKEVEEYENNNEENIWDKYIDDDRENKLPKQLLDLNFKCYYSKPVEKGNVIFLYDGINGEYVKLIYIESVDYSSNDESDINPIINEALKKQPVPIEVYEKLQEIYSIIFKNDTKIEVYLQYFNHWH